MHERNQRNDGHPLWSKAAWRVARVRSRAIAERSRCQRDRGFTIVEVLVVMVMVGILGAIAGPGWLAFLNNQRVRQSGDRALLAAREAQAEAKKRRAVWVASFREIDDEVQWAVHPEGSETPRWQGILEGESNRVEIDAANSTLSSDCEVGDYCVKFDDRGTLDRVWFDAQSPTDSLVGRVTFMGRDTIVASSKRCLSITTLLGSMQVARGDNCSS